MFNYIDNHTDSQKSFRSIFAFIVSKGKTTRREIQKETNYSWSSVSSVVSVLLNKKHVIETESFCSGVGRGTTYIIPNGNKFVSIGLDITSLGFSLSIIGIDESVKYEEKYVTETYDKDTILNTIFLLVDKGLAICKDKYDVVSLGISCSGDVIDHSIFLRSAHCKGPININFKELIEAKYGIHTFVEHDTNCVLEHYRSVYAVEPLSVCVARVISGIGFAIYTNGHSLEDFGFIDFGHIIVQAKDGAKCICGGNGCLEAYSSSAGICNRAGVSNFNEIANDREKYRSYLDDAAFYLGITFANIKRIFSIGKVVVTGNVLENDEVMVNKVVESIKKHLTIDSVEFEYVQELSASFGAARLSLLDKIATGKTL